MVKKRGKTKLLVLLFIFAIVLLSLFLFQYKNITGNAISTINFPTDCSETNISTLWNSIFLESSTGISFVYNETNLTNGRCDNLIIAKTLATNESYLLWFLSGVDSNGKYNSALVAKKTKFNSSKDNYSSVVSQEIVDNPLARMFLVFTLLPASSTVNRSVPISSSSGADNEFYLTYNTTVLIGTLISNESIYGFNETENYTLNRKNYSKSLAAMIYKNLSEQIIVYQDKEVDGGCVPNWTRQETSCYPNETRIIFYNDSKSCGVSTGKPSDIVSYCDYNLNGVIGDYINNLTYLNLTLYISGNLINSSLNYSNLSSLQLVEIKRDGKAFISFIYNFSKTLDLTNISIQTNSASSNLGYILINGIDNKKSVIFDKKNSSSDQVCILDDYVSSVSQISAFCDEGDEFLLNCPGNSSKYTCLVSNSSFNISGLAHSGIKEMFSLATCTTNWSCAPWGSCVNKVRNRTCSDVNICNTTIGRPALTEACAVAPPVCLINWSCSEWSPVNCSSNVNRTRICTDKNNCNSLTGKPSELSVCDSDNNSFWGIYLWITFGISGILLIILIIYLIVQATNKKEVLQNDNPSAASRPVQPVQGIAPPIQKYIAPKPEPPKSSDNPGDIPSV